MSCRGVRRRLSAFVDGELFGRDRLAVARHLDACPDCRFFHVSLRATLERVADLPRVELGDPGSIVSAVLDRIEIEQRGAGLGLLLRPASRARPFMLPSLLPAALLVALALAGTLALHRPLPPPEPPGGLAGRSSPSPLGTEGNPLFPSSAVQVPRLRARIEFPEPFLSSQGEESVFLETVVARDGSVSAVTLIDGKSDQAKALAAALRLERFEPVRLSGRPVAVSVYRLFSRTEVRGRST